MNVLVILGHPRQESFCGALATAILAALLGVLWGVLAVGPTAYESLIYLSVLESIESNPIVRSRDP